MSGGLSKLGTALTVIFAVSLLALFAELFYVLWRRRIFRRRADSAAAAGGVESSTYSPSSSESLFSASSVAASSKELLYFFCIRSHQFRLPQNSSDNTAHGTSNSTDLNSSNQQSDMEVIDIDLFKIQGMFGPPRFLFTIKEEEREDVESPAAMKSLCTEKEVTKEKVSLEERFKEDEEAAVVVEIDDNRGGGGGVDGATPFSTPCASPVYLTPAASPVREAAAVGGRLPPEGLTRETAPYGRSADV